MVFELIAWKTARLRAEQAALYDQFQPSTNSDKLSERPKAPHRFLIAILWDSNPVLGRPDVNPGGIEIHLR